MEGNSDPAALAHHAVAWLGRRGEWRLRTVAAAPGDAALLRSMMRQHPGAVVPGAGWAGPWTCEAAWIGRLVPATAGGLLGAPPPEGGPRWRYAALATPSRGVRPPYICLLDERPDLYGVVAESPLGGWVLVEPFRPGPAAARMAALARSLRADGLSGPAGACEAILHRLGRAEAPDPITARGLPAAAGRAP